MSKFQNYLKTFDITSTLTEEDIDKTLALLQIYGPAVRRTASRIGEMEEECYEGRRQSISDFINLAIDYDRDTDRKRIADRLAEMGHSMQLLSVMEDALVLVKDTPPNGGTYFNILQARYFDVYCTSNEEAYLNLGISSSTYYRHIKPAIRAYCRVSTMSEMQAESFEIQQQYYSECIAKHPNWVLVRIYADEGISATSVKNRKEFNQMIEDCQAGKIDMIITKSVSRFARNVVDCIKYARMLRSLSPPVSIYFETENINTLSQNGELLLTVLAAFAQDESVNKSISVAWGIRQRFAKGIPKLVKPYGYQLEDNKLIVDEEEAGVVIRIFAFYLGGKTPYEIAKILTSEGIPSPTGKSHWTVSSVTYILGNDRYCGDIIMQKSICVDLFAHKRVRNLGQAERFRVRGVHTPLVSKEDWREVKNRVSMPDREAVILEDITGEGVLAELHPIQFKEDIDI